jgi:hypothetical protein
MKDPSEHGLQLINRYSGLPGTVVSWDVVTDTVIVRLACGQEANYSVQQISQLWQIISTNEIHKPTRRRN